MTDTALLTVDEQNILQNLSNTLDQFSSFVGTDGQSQLRANYIYLQIYATYGLVRQINRMKVVCKGK